MRMGSAAGTSSRLHAARVMVACAYLLRSPQSVEAQGIAFRGACSAHLELTSHLASADGQSLFVSASQSLLRRDTIVAFGSPVYSWKRDKHGEWLPPKSSALYGDRKSVV